MSSALGILTAAGEAVAAANVVVEKNQNVHVSLTVTVNWSGDGVTFVDESTYCRSFMSSRGRARVNDQVGTGSCTLAFRNIEGRFSPRNVNSALYPNVVVGRAVTVTATYRGTIYAQFSGTISQIDQDTHAETATVTLTILDAFDHFRLAKAKADLDAGVAPDPTVDAVLTAILAAAGWTGPTRFDAGASLTSYAQTTDNVLQALQHAALQEIHGLLFMGKDGAVVFQNAAHRQHTAVSFALSSVERMNLSARQSDVIDTIRVVYTTKVWSTDPTVVYTSQAGMQLPAQTAITIADDFTPAAVIDVIEPVRGTDISANGLADGSDVDASEAIWLESFTSTGVAFTASIYNSLPYDVYLRQFQIRATALTTTSVSPFVELTTATALIAAQTFTRTLDYVTDRGTVFQWAAQRLAAMSQQRPRPTVTIVAKTPALMRLILGLDISDRLAIVDVGGDEAGVFDIALFDEALFDAGGPWLSWLMGQFYVEQITLTITPHQIVTATLQLFDFDMGIG